MVLPLDSYIINPETGCWDWLLGKTSAGYGVIYIEGKPFYAHRIVLFGTEDNPLHACHKCDNPSCVNRDHLFEGTNKDNHIDMTNKGRNRNQNTNRTTCQRGHNLFMIDSKGYRYCVTCRRAKERERYARNK